MFEWVKSGKSLNKVIESIVGNCDNKKDNGISGYLSNEIYKRDIFDSSAVQSALLKMGNLPIYNLLDNKVKEKYL